MRSRRCRSRPSDGWKPLGTEEPITYILLVLATTVGLPYLLLASTSPLLQAWFARARPGADPYRLFAVSNLASLLALVGYPLVVEPFLGNREQVVWWSVLFAVFAVLCVRVGLVCFGGNSPEDAFIGSKKTPLHPVVPTTCCGWRCRRPGRCCCSR